MTADYTVYTYFALAVTALAEAFARYVDLHVWGEE
jgi:hypothetical protein